MLNGTKASEPLQLARKAADGCPVAPSALNVRNANVGECVLCLPVV